MPTTKKRINITLPDKVEVLLEKISRRDNVPVATKAMQLLAIGLESEEDVVWDKIASSRDTKDATFVSHDEAWL